MGYIYIYILPKNPKVEHNKYHGAHTYVNGVHVPSLSLDTSWSFRWWNNSVRKMVLSRFRLCLNYKVICSLRKLLEPWDPICWKMILSSRFPVHGLYLCIKKAIFIRQGVVVPTSNKKHWYDLIHHNYIHHRQRLHDDLRMIELSLVTHLCVLGSKLPLFPYNRGWSSTQFRRGL